MSSDDVQTRLDHITTRCSYIKKKVTLLEDHIDKASIQIHLLTNKIMGVRVRRKAAVQQENVIFQNHLGMELATLESVRCAYRCFVDSRKRNLAKLELQIFDLEIEMYSLTKRMQDEVCLETHGSGCEEIVDLCENINKLNTKST